MDPSDRLEEDFKFYLFFFEKNYKELRNEKDKALCQEWLQRLEEMRETRKQRRDRNIYLSQLALAMAEGKLCPPFNAPPPREPLPIPASLFEMFQTGVTVHGKHQENLLEISSSTTRSETSGKYWTNDASGNIKGKWAVNSMQDPEKIMLEKLQKSPSEKSSLSARSDISEKYRSNANINRLQTPEKIIYEKLQTKQSDMSSPSTESDTSGKHRQNDNIYREQTPEKTIYEKLQTKQSDMSSPSTESDTSGKHRQNDNIYREQTPEKTVNEKPQENQSELSTPSSRADSNDRHQPNGNINRLQSPETTVHNKPQTSQSEMSSPSARAETSGQYQPNWNINRRLGPEKTVYEKPQTIQTVMSSSSAKADTNGNIPSNGNINKVRAPETAECEKSQTNKSEMSSPSERAATSGKYWTNVAFGKEKSKWNINDKQGAGENVTQNSQMTLSEMSSLGSLSDQSVEKWLATNYKEDESKLALFSPNEIVPQDQQMMLFKVPFFISSSETSTERLSEAVNYEEKNKWSNDKSLAADKLDSRKSQALQSGAPPCISSSDLKEEQFRQVGSSSEKSKPSNKLLFPVGEMELHSRNLSDSQTAGLPNFRINPVKNIQRQQPVLPSKNHSDSWTKLIPRAKFHSKKKLDFQRPELKPANYSYYRTCVLSNDKLNSERTLDYQKPGGHFTNFFDSRMNVLSKARFNPDVDLSLQRPVVSRTCPQPSQMPSVEEKLESQSTNDAFVSSQWEKIATEDKAVPHADSLASLLSYSKGQWLEQSCDSDSFISALSAQSAMSENPTEINRHNDSPSVHSELLQEIRLSEKEIQSVSLQSSRVQSQKSTPVLSLTSVTSKGGQKNFPMSTVPCVQDQYTQTQSLNHLPQEKNAEKKPMFLPVYIVSADQQPFLLYTPLTASQIHGSQLIIPTASELQNTPTSHQLQNRISSKAPKQSNKINKTVHYSKT